MLYHLENLTYFKYNGTMIMLIINSGGYKISMNQIATNSNDTSLHKGLSIAEIMQTLDDLEKKYKSSSNAALITLETPISDIKFVPDKDKRLSPRTESLIHTILRVENINTLGELLKEYQTCNNTIRLERIGPKCSSYITAYIQAFEQQQQLPSETDKLSNLKIDLESDIHTVSLIIQQLDSQLPMDDSLLEKILTAFKEMKTEEDKKNLMTLIDTFENEDLKKRAKTLETLLDKEKARIYNIFQKTLTTGRIGVSYEDECK